MVKLGYKQTELGIIPDNWDVKPLKEVAPLQRGFDLPYSSIKKGLYPVVFSNGVGAFHSTYMVKGPGVVTGRSGTIGKIHYVENDYWPHNTALWVTDFHNNDPLFVYYLFKTIPWDLYNSGSGVPTLNRNDVHDYLVAVPSKNEQTEIATMLADIDSLIESIEKQLIKKKAIKQGAMQELLTGKRRLPGFSGEWGTKKLGDYCSLITKQTGFDYSAYIKPALITRKMPNTLPMIQTINFRGRKFAFETDYYIPKSVAMQFPNIVLNEKCVLFSIVGASVGNVGLYPGGITAFCGGAIGITRFHDEQDAEWVYNYMSSPDGQSQIQYVTKGGAQATVTIADIRNFKIPTPEKDERDAISSILENMDHEIEVLEEKLAKYRQVKQGMMQQLLTGKIRLTKDIEDSVQTEQVTAEKAMPSKPAHNHQFDDAVAIAAIVDAFYSDKYPLGRVKVQKLLYLLHRHQAVSVSDFKKKAAGPYADTVRYKGGEPIAKKNKYIVTESGKQGTRYSKGENISQALEYVVRWSMQADLQWLKENFLHTSRNDLELFATVDMAMCDLDEVGIAVSVTSIKNLIASNKEWKAKLSKAYFSDWDIARAIKKCAELFN